MKSGPNEYAAELEGFATIKVCDSYQSFFFTFSGPCIVICGACPESKGTKVLNMYNFFNLQKRHCE